MHLGIIGFGNIATELIGLVQPQTVSRITVLVRSHTVEAAQSRAASYTSGPKVEIVSDLSAFVSAGPDIVVECAGHSAVADYGAALLGRNIDLVVVSVGALADEDLYISLTQASRSEGAGRLILPIGAIGGIDLLSSLAQAGKVDVTYSGIKPPVAWKGTRAEEAIDLDAIEKPTRFFSGNAREAAKAYPKNANVVAALALAGSGFDTTRVELIADPGAGGNTHRYEVMSPICRYNMEIEARPSPDNPRTSATTALSVVAEIKRVSDARNRQSH